MARRAALVFALSAAALSPSHTPASGWGEASLSRLDSPRCTIERIPLGSLTPERFAQEYFGRAPVVIDGAATPELWPLAFDKWRKPALLAEYGERSVLVRVAASSCLTDHAQCVSSDGRREVPLREHLASLASAPPDASLETLGEASVPYTHDRHFLKHAIPEARGHFSTPSAICGATPLPCSPTETATAPPAGEQPLHEDPLFFLGGAGSGVGFHRHGHAWNVVVYGRKRWFLYPPPFEHSTVLLSNSSLDGVAWAKRYLWRVEGTPLAPLECTLGPEELLYIPQDWNHATINIQDSIGVAMNYGSEKRGLRVLATDFHFGTDPLEQIQELYDFEYEKVSAKADEACKKGSSRRKGKANGGRFPKGSSQACAEASLVSTKYTHFSMKPSFLAYFALNLVYYDAGGRAV